MRVLKRDGTLDDVKFDKITDRIASQCKGLDPSIDPTIIAQEITVRIRDGITTSELDNLTADFCAVKAIEHPDYGILASRIVITDHQKNTNFLYPNFTNVMKTLYNNKDQMDEHSPLISKEIYDIVNSPNEELLNQIIQPLRDFNHDYFGFKTLMKSYLLKIKDRVIETPQYMWLRVSLGIHGNDLHRVKQTYNLMSQKYFTHASPTLFNAGTPRPQMSSCFLVSGSQDSLEGIFKTMTDCAKISKWAGGIGVHISGIRADGSFIRGTGGKSDGLVPMLRMYNNNARWINQGGRRNGSFAMYLEPWHADVFQFLDCKKNHGSEELRARDLFYALWVPDLFMERVKNGEKWSLMCPSECPGLQDVYGDDFKQLYESYEEQGKVRRIIEARELWNEIINSQIETGVPYIGYKDAVNRKSNQKNVGTIKSSNLCIEIMEYTDENETSVCNLASLVLPTFVNTKDSTFDFKKLIEVTSVVTYNLNQIIDKNYYPIPEAKKSNMRHRPIGIGVQGLADTFSLLRIPFDSPQAMELNKQIFETIYFGALLESNRLAQEFGPYDSFHGSPFSQGKFQFDLCREFDNLDPDYQFTDPTLNWEWESLRTSIVNCGTRNSLVTALMPTASTSQIMGSNECFEPYTSNVYKRRTLAGEFPVINKHLIRDLIRLDLWNDKTRYELIKNNGSVQDIQYIPQDIKNLYKTVWEIKQKVIIDMAAHRGLYVDQSQSMNLFFEQPEFNTLYKAHMYSWRSGLKSGSYYIRSKPAIDAQSTTNTYSPEDDDDESTCISCSG